MQEAGIKEFISMSVNYAWASLLLLLMASRLPLFVTCALLSCGIGAAELGEPRISSFIGQPLAVEVELTALASPTTPVQARLANPNVYRGANIGMPPVLSSLAMHVTQRDGRQFLRVTSSMPVESSRLHLYLELADGGGRDVRLLTLFLAANPNPPPAPVPVAVPVPVKAPVVAEAPVVPVAPPKPVAVVKPAPPKPPRPAPPAKPVVVAKAEPKAEAEAVPTPAPVIKPVSKPALIQLPKPPLPTSPLPLPVAAATLASASCALSSGIDRATVCAALDYKNAQLREQIATLEGKVRVLQVALGANPSAVVQDKPAAPVNPRPSRKRPAPEPEAAMPWGWIVGGVAAVLALAGGALVLVRRRKRTGVIKPMPGVPLMTRLRQRFARKKKAPAPVEPQLDEPKHETSTQV
jgi:hypothetical protein